VSQLKKTFVVADAASKKTNTDFHSSPLGRMRMHLEALVGHKDEVIDAALGALLCGGHVLLEDVPGVGKTTFIKAVAKLLGQEMIRIQFTSDLLPSDIIGVEVYNPSINEFVFHKGPVFTRILLADELNRASPRTQSALLEAMGEGYVTEGRKTHELPKPFIVFASQNPHDSIGTYDLPESQLDRFAAKIHLGYPTTKREVEILQAASMDPLESLPSGVLCIEDLLKLQKETEAVHVSERIIAYAKKVIDSSRSHADIKIGVSTRGGVIWLRMAKAKALLSSRDFVIPDDLREIAVSCLAHRIVVRGGIEAENCIRVLLSQIEVV
jgi:MoxR-like ATPase